MTTPGTLRVVVGCMFSGKTSALIAAGVAARKLGCRVVGFKHAEDGRYHPRDLAAHLGGRFPAVAVCGFDPLLELDRVERGRGLCLVDELQFFPVAAVLALDLLRQRGWHVLAAGLDHWSDGEACDTTRRAMLAADDFRLLTGTCADCGAPSRRHAYRGPLLGGPRRNADVANWVALCERCHETLCRAEAEPCADARG